MDEVGAPGRLRCRDARTGGNPQDLLERLRRGERTAFDEAYDRAFRVVHSYVWRAVADGRSARGVTARVLETLVVAALDGSADALLADLRGRTDDEVSWEELALSIARLVMARFRADASGVHPGPPAFGAGAVAKSSARDS